MPKESTIQHYNSSVTGNAPSSGDLSVGEIAINTSDEKVFLKNLGGTVLSLSQTKDLSGSFAFKNQVVSSFNGATGTVLYSPSLATVSATGVASFNPSDFGVASTGHVSLTGNVARTNAANTFSGLQTFSNGLSAHGATFASGSTVRLSSLASHPEVNLGGGIYSGGSIAGEAVNNVYFVAGQGGNGEWPTKPYITFQNNSTDPAADNTFSTLGGDIKFTANTDIDIVASNGNVNISSASGGIVIDPVTFVNMANGVLYVDDTNNRVGINDTTPSVALDVNGGISGGSLIIAAGATFNSLANFAAGLTTANLFVTSGVTFNSLANFAAGLTTANLFVTSGVTFNSRANFAAGLTTANLMVSDGATFGGNINSATLKDYGEVFAYQVRKEVGDTKANTKYLVNLNYGNTFYLDLNTDNSGVLGGYATQQTTPVIRLPAYGYATVSTTAGLTGATASFIIGSSTAAVTGCFIFGPGLTSAGVTAVSYNALSQTLVLSKAAQQTVSAQPHAFVRNTTEGYGMVASPNGGSPSVLSPARVHSFTLIVNSAAAGAITWQTGATHYGQIKWPSGTAPTLSTTANKLDVFSFRSTDWGTTWLAFNAGQNF